jgi:hypothetical protein
LFSGTITVYVGLGDLQKKKEEIHLAHRKAKSIQLLMMISWQFNLWQRSGGEEGS